MHGRTGALEFVQKAQTLDICNDRYKVHTVLNRYKFNLRRQLIKKLASYNFEQKLIEVVFFLTVNQLILRDL